MHSVWCCPGWHMMTPPTSASPIENLFVCLLCWCAANHQPNECKLGMQPVQPVQPQKSLRMKIKYKISILWHQPSIFCLQFVLLPGTDDQICSAPNLNSNKINLLINFIYLKVSFSIFSFSPYTDHNTHYWAEKLKSIQSLNSERQTRNTINWKMRLQISDVENLKKKSVDLAEQMHGWLDIVPSISAFFMCRVEMQSVERIIYNEELVQVDCVKQC